MDRGRAALPHRALQNLLTNALRHADRRVRISYRVSLERCRVDVEDDGPGCRRRNGSGSLRHSYAWTTAGPVLPAGMAWDCPSSGGSSTGMAAGPPSAAARLWAVPASPWPGRARQVCATAEKLTEIWRLAICKCLRRRIPGVAKHIERPVPPGVASIPPGAKVLFSWTRLFILRDAVASGTPFEMPAPTAFCRGRITRTALRSRTVEVFPDWEGHL